ncbi:MAG: hypothetical protein IAF38_06095 [Bacteroidia bacterium]|nr:hypothetical protein [Bacteroidia bacterium]
MKKIIFSGISTLLISAGLFAQSSSKKTDTPKERTREEKTFHSIGTSVYMDVYNGPIREKEITTTYTDAFGNPVTNTTYDYSRVTGYSYFTLIYHYRYNMHEMNDNAALSISAFPSAGIFVGATNPGTSVGVIQQGYGCFNLPIMAGFEAGAAATQGSSSPIGLFLGAGYELNCAPLMYAKTTDNRDIKTKWVNPCVSIGVRYESKSNFGNLQEINLKMGFGLASMEIKEPNNMGQNLYTFTKAFTFRLSYFTYLNY